MRLHPRLGLLRDHDFRQLFASTTVSQVGLQVTELAIVLVAIDHLGASEFEAGLLVTMQFAAFLLVGLPAGALVDRMRRRSVLIVCDVGRGLLLVSVPVAWWAGVLTIWQLYAVALVHGVLTVFFHVAYQSYLPHLVGRENLVEGNSKLEAVRAASDAGGPGVAGQLIRLLTAPVALLVDAVAMAASALFYVRIRKQEPKPVRRSDTHLGKEIGEGLRFVLGHRLLRAIATCTGSGNLFTSLKSAMLVFFLRRELGLGAGEIGLVLSIFSVGGLLGAFGARRFAGWVGQGRALWMSIAFTAPFMLPLALAEPGWWLWFAAALGLVTTAGIVAYNVIQVSFRQALTPDHLLGRMNATIRFLVWGTMPLGGLLGAFLGDWLGARPAVLIGVLGTCLAFLPVFLSPLRSMRTLPTAPPEEAGAPITTPSGIAPAGTRRVRAARSRRARHDAGMTENPLYTKHADTLARALTAISERDYWSAFPESPSPRVYGETAAAEGKAAFEAYLGKPFPIDQPGDRVATEVSPFGIALGIGYPHTDVDTLIAHATAALPGWRDAGPRTRAGVCLEILGRLHAHVFELANAVHATSGQAFVMAFQAGGPHALDRGLEAVAYAYAEQTRHPATAEWTKPAKGEPLRMTKTFHMVPRGVALVIGCNTFPTWNSYPGFFASLATGNPVIVKPHPGAVLPMAVTVRYAREVLAEAGFDPNLVQLAAEPPGEKIASSLATRPEVKIVDFTGSTAYGEWLEANARQATVYTEKAGVNTIVVDSTDDFAGMCRNIGFSLSLYSGQMCTTPQNILVPRAGIETDQGRKSFEEVAAGIAESVRKQTAADPARGVELTGAIANQANLHRIDEARGAGKVLLDSIPLEHPNYPNATVRTPLVLEQTTDGESVFDKEWFGPISFVVATDSTEQSLALFRRIVGARGALTASVYSTDEQVLDATEDAAVAVGVHLSCNLTGGVFVNQSAAFSDFHATGANPAANASLTDGAYVANRFRVVQSRRHT